ncbi:hypothetical protein BaRGS_00017580 [Batillaria attramentaria]|uniref:Bursicon n=1 Tax=Batillaria attramentaria TaxID=370345 RepID=A0ABD0KVH0_9CAEN
MMERSLGLLFLVAPFLLLSSLPGKHQVLALEVLGADGNADNGNQGKHGNQGNDGNQGNPENPDEDSMAMVIARNSKLSDAQNSQEAMMVIICANLQGNVTECADVTPFQEYFNNLPPRAPSDTQPTRRRRKRFSNCRLTANVTCPFAQLRLWQYQSQAAGGMCWIMQNVQENIVYRVCGEKFCRNCKDKSFSGSGFSNLNQKLCITDYTRVSVWAYCPNLNPGSRIIRDRIIIPQSCSCQSIQCEAIPNWRK